MNNSSGIIITTIVLGIVTLVAGGLYLGNQPRDTLKTLPNYGAFEKNDDDDAGLRFRGGKKSRKHHRRHKRKTIKH